MFSYFKKLANSLTSPEDKNDLFIHDLKSLFKKYTPRGHIYISLIRELSSHGITAFQDKFSSNYFRRLNFDVDILIDVGVHNGTYELYDGVIKKNTKLILIDPVKETLDHTGDRYSQYNPIIENCALGATEKKTKLKIFDKSGHSSLLDRDFESGDTLLEERIVPVLRLDSIFLKYASKFKISNIGLKLDVEGFEYEVLKGSKQTLKSCQFVLLEVSVKRLYKNGYKFSEIIKIMADNDFEILDILNPKGKTPAFMDCLFVKSDSQWLSPNFI